MPLSTNLANFPTRDYLAVITKAIRSGEVSIPCTSKKEATRVRQEMYHIIKLIRENAALVQQEPYFTFIMEISSTPVILTIDGSTLFIRRRPNTVSRIAEQLLRDDPNLLSPTQLGSSPGPGLTVGETVIPLTVGPSAPKLNNDLLSGYGLGDDNA